MWFIKTLQASAFTICDAVVVIKDILLMFLTSNLTSLDDRIFSLIFSHNTYNPLPR